MQKQQSMGLVEPSQTRVARLSLQIPGSAWKPSQDYHPSRLQCSGFRQEGGAGSLAGQLDVKTPSYLVPNPSSGHWSTGSCEKWWRGVQLLDSTPQNQDSKGIRVLQRAGAGQTTLGSRTVSPPAKEVATLHSPGMSWVAGPQASRKTGGGYSHCPLGDREVGNEAGGILGSIGGL